MCLILSLIPARNHNSSKGMWPTFEEMPPIFCNKTVPSKAVPQHMKDYLTQSNRKPMHDRQNLVEVHAFGLFYAPLMKLFLEHGLKITAVYRTINYRPQKIFTWFVHKVTENRCKGDQNPDQATCWPRCSSSWATQCVRKDGRSGGGADDGELHQGQEGFYERSSVGVDPGCAGDSDVHEIELRKCKVVTDKPFHMGIVVYQMAKPLALQFF